MRLATALAFFLALSSAADAATLKVALDKSARISLARPARDIVVANPKVADVTLIDARNIVVLGKGYGTTSLLVVDAAGRTIADHEIVVSSPDTGAVSFYRGSKVQSFACEARCEPTSDAPASDAAPAPASSTP
jgi:Flp pilus assembly secretin CpaC